jgi:hypothetical protein
MAAAISARAAAARRVVVEGNVLRALLARVARHEARLEALEAERRARHADPAVDGHLLSSIAAVFGASTFTVGDLRNTPDAELRGVVAGAPGRVVGAWLKRLRRQPVAPYQLHRVTRDDRGVVWALTVDTASSYRR